MNSPVQRFEFPDDEVWHVHLERRSRGGPPRLNIRIEVSPPGGEPGVVARLHGDPFDPLFLERFAAQAASRNGADASVYAGRLTAIADSLLPVPAREISSALHSTPPLIGASDAVQMLLGSELVELSEHPTPKPRSWTVDGVLPQGRITGLFGTYGTLKTILAGHLALCVATGSPWLGHQTLQTNVLWIDTEEDLDESWRRLDGLARGLYLSGIPPGLFYLSLTHPLVDVIDTIGALVKENSYGLIVLDSIGPAISGDPDSAEVVVPFYEAMRSVESTWLTTDHESKFQSTQNALSRRMPFGSQYKGALSRSLVSVVAPDAQNHPGHVVLLHQKNSYGRPFEPKAVRARWESGTTYIEEARWSDAPFNLLKGVGGGPRESVATARSKILDAFAKGPLTQGDVQQRTQLAQGTVRNNVGQLIADGLVRKRKNKGVVTYELVKTKGMP